MLHRIALSDQDKPTYPTRHPGESDAAYQARMVDAVPVPRSLPEDPARYFHMEGAKLVPVAQLVSTEPSGRVWVWAARFMRAAYDGASLKRKPISISPLPEGKFAVEDGNGTLAAATHFNWKHLPAVMVAPGSKGH